MAVFFAGSFNPFTKGHASIVSRALAQFDAVIIGVGYNVSKPEAAGEAGRRRDAIAALYAGDSRVTVCVYDSLTGEAARCAGATALVRGVRSVRDFEYERDMADVNRRIFGLETVLFFAQPDMAYLSSSVVRELQAFGHDVSDFLPEAGK